MANIDRFVGENHLKNGMGLLNMANEAQQQLVGSWDSWRPDEGGVSTEDGDNTATCVSAPLVANTSDPAAPLVVLPAAPEELGAWNAKGTRVWGYSTDGGESEQGRFEFNAGGRLRTTWGWGEWCLQDSSPPEEAKEFPHAKPHMVVSWNGWSDVIALDSSGIHFELVSRNGRSASNFRFRTVGRALPGATVS